MKSLERTSLIIGVAVGLVGGLLLGMLLFWQLFPVRWTDAHSYDLAPESKAEFVGLLADSFKLDRNPERVGESLALWTAEEKQQAFTDAVNLYESEGQMEKALAVKDLALVLGIGAAPSVMPSEPGEAPTGLLDRLRVPCLTFVLVLLSLVLGWIGVRAVRARRAGSKLTTSPPSPRFARSTPRDVSSEDSVGNALDRFNTAYQVGEDNYDESFSIETPEGEFLGECGVGISDTVGTGDTDRVTAFEVWLFDKSDIRTVTKVLMSEHAFQDETQRAKLASKGEAVLAEMQTPFYLETSSLRLKVTVTGLEYGDEELEPQSIFTKLDLELIPFSRSSTHEASLSG